MLNISIIIPIYKVPLKHLQACLDSLVAQTMQECEFILVSDGAPETECSVCEEYATKDSRFKFFKREHTGVSAVRNYGINQAQGDYITFVDSDDTIEKNYCQTIHEKASKWNSDILIFEHIYQKNNKSVYYSIYNSDIPQIQQKNQIHLLNEVFFSQKNYGLILMGVWCKAIKKSFIKESNIKFDERLCYSEDQLFCLNLFLKTNKISYLASPLYHQIYRAGSISFTYKEKYDKEVISYLNSINSIFSNYHFFNKHSLCNRSIQCILYTLDKCIFRPDSKLTYSKRKELFNNFLEYPICKDSLLHFEKNKFKFSERILCFLCKHRFFFPLLLISKKWHWDRKRLIRHNLA